LTHEGRVNPPRLELSSIRFRGSIVLYKLWQ
jgi:hypothetical protein